MENQILIINKEDLRTTLNEMIKDIIGQLPSNENDKKAGAINLTKAADYCVMPVPTFRTYLKKEQIIGSKIGKSWKFYRSDLDEFISKYRRNIGIDNNSNNYQIGVRHK